MKYSFFKEKDKAIYFSGNTMEIYIPRRYFNEKLAHFKGNKISTLGIFDFVVYIDESRKETDGQRHSFNLPMNIEFEFVDYFKTKDPHEKEKEGLYCFVLTDGCMFLDNTYREMSASNTKDFIIKLNSGKLSSSVKYEDILKLYIDSMILNGVNLNNASVMYEIIISELCRSKKDEKIPFRKDLNSGRKISSYDYELINIRDLPSISSTFSALMSTDLNKNIEKSLLKTKKNEEEIESPLEKVIKY